MDAEEKNIVGQLSTLFRNLKWVMAALGIVTFVLNRRPLSYVILGIACVLFIHFLWQAIPLKIWKILSMILVTILVVFWIGINVRKDIRNAQGILFAPAKASELLVMVAQFEKKGGTGIDPTRRIVERLQSEIEKTNIQDIRIETVPTMDNKEKARKIGDIHNSVVVIWGWYDDAGFNPYFTVIKEREGPLPKTEMKEIPTELKEFNLYIREGLPAYMSYFMTSTIGYLYLWNREYDKALSAITTAVKIFDRIPHIEGIQAPGGLDSLYFYRGYIQQLAKSDLDQAVGDYSKAIELDSSKASYYYNRGIAYKDKGDLDQAVADYIKAIELDPSKTNAYIYRGNVYFGKGDLDQAIADFSKAIELDPLETIAYYNRGNAYKDKGDLDQALVDYGKAIELDPSKASCYYNRGNLYFGKGDLDQAIADYIKAIELDPSKASYYYNRGIAYKDLGDLDKAIADYSKAIELDPSKTNAYNNRGIAYKDKGDLDQAITDISKAIEFDPSKASYYYNRGFVYRLKDFKAKAINDFQMYLRLFPNPPNRTQVEQWILELKK